MSLQNALRFIAAVRDDAELHRKVEELGATASLEQIAAIGVAAGYAFTAQELRRAHPIDWKMRGAHFSSPSDAEVDE